MTPAPYRLERRGRSRRNAVALGLTLLGATVLAAIGAHPIFVGLLLIPAALLAWEVGRDTRSVLRLDDGGLHWRRGTRGGELPLARLDHVRLLRRLDLSTMVELRLTDGTRLRLPHELCADPAGLETALAARGITVRRVAFSFV